MDVSIIIVNYNNFAETIECVKSLQKLKNNVLYNIVIVDNCSPNTDFNNLLELYNSNENIYVIKTDINKGYCAGNNYGIKYALEQFNSRFIWILNPDTLIEENCLTELFSFANSHLDCGILGAKLVHYPDTDTLQALGGCLFKPNKIGRLTPGKCFYAGEPSDCELPEFVTCDCIIGASMFIRKEVFKDCGFMNESFFLYSDETEFCLRVRNSTWKIYAISKAVVYHAECARVNPQRKLIYYYYNTRNELLMIKELFPKHVYFQILTYFIYILFYLTKGKLKYAKYMFLGMTAFFKGETGKTTRVIK
ncbi:glycosyltransferase family 2 protein [Treponema ruminis]|uniref:GT2 family glycosyltransferase n=1 Tax=Treponema ruminis TaxID=744515 RepID=A0A7W8GA72_9SPIR|nr:glycosyltransferase family 2 protein [Treponema ruminis]MBB5226585.1 GT2 family glycosyltransferase [Treponema ruminis]QSI02185.1 glycosyltransferase family 2 protein [Treponema ruminis]